MKKTIIPSSLQNALMIASIYGVIGLLWIYFSDSLVEIIGSDTHELSLLQTYKGWFFILLTSVLLFGLVYRSLEREFRQYKNHIAALDKHQKAEESLQNDLRRREALLRSIINSSPDAIFVKDTEGKYLIFNEGASRIVGKSPDVVLGRDDTAIFAPETAKTIRQNDKQIMEDGNVLNFEEELTTANGTSKQFWVTKGPVYTEDSKLVGLFGISRDITERKQYEANLLKSKQEADYISRHDSLTHLPNHLDLITTLEKQINDVSPFALMFIDLDGFKEVNDSYGHYLGDRLLIRVTRLFEHLFPKQTYIARTGGDEFFVILQCPEGRACMEAMMQHFTDTFAHPMEIEGIDIYITASVGIAFYPEDAATTDDLLQNVDAAMYNAKKMGKNTYSFYRSRFTEEAIERINITAGLKKAIRNGELSLYYQPQVDIRTSQIIGAEALIRWLDPKGSISPDKFIPIAEENGLIIEIGELVLLEGCKRAVEWIESGMFHGRIAINVSARQLVHPNFMSRLETLVHQSGCNPAHIELEITESSILENPNRMIRLLRSLKTMGFYISIDDFGTGYSSLSYLKNLPIDKLKIDQSFVRNLAEEPKNQTIVRTIIDLCEGLGMASLAEGAETQEEIDLLRTLGVKLVQGYYYHRPMPLDAINALLSRQNATM